jgi:hypothetical protein
MATTSASTPIAGGRLIGDDRHPIPGAPQARERAQRIGVQVVGREATVGTLDRRQAKLPVVRAEDREDVAVLTAPRNHRPEGGMEGQPRDTQLIGPDRPDPGLVDQRLPDVEAHPSVAHDSMLDE